MEIPTPKKLAFDMFQSWGWVNSDLENWEPREYMTEDQFEKWMQEPVAFSEFQSGNVHYSTDGERPITYEDLIDILQQALKYITPSVEDLVKREVEIADSWSREFYQAQAEQNEGKWI